MSWQIATRSGSSFATRIRAIDSNPRVLSLVRLVAGLERSEQRIAGGHDLLDLLPSVRRAEANPADRLRSRSDNLIEGLRLSTGIAHFASRMSHLGRRVLQHGLCADEVFPLRQPLGARDLATRDQHFDPRLQSARAAGDSLLGALGLRARLLAQTVEAIPRLLSQLRRPPSGSVQGSRQLGGGTLARLGEPSFGTPHSFERVLVPHPDSCRELVR